MNRSIQISTILIFICFSLSCSKEVDTLPGSEFSIVFPNGGELLEKGNIYEIVWSNDLNENVRIELFYNEEMVETITSSSENNGKYLWKIPDNIEEGTYYKIQIETLGIENNSEN